MNEADRDGDREVEAVPIFCPNCALRILIGEELMGRKGQCPGCGYKFVIEASHRKPPDVDDLGTDPTIKIVSDEAFDDGFDFDLGGERRPWLNTVPGVVALVCGILWILAGLWVAGCAGVEAKPAWMTFAAHFHRPFVHGAIALLAAGALMELLGRTRRFEPVVPAIPLVLGLAVFTTWAGTTFGACGGEGFGAWAVLSLVGLAGGGLSLTLSLTMTERLDQDRTALLVAIVFGLGALLTVGHLAEGAVAGV